MKKIIFIFALFLGFLIQMRAFSQVKEENTRIEKFIGRAYLADDSSQFLYLEQHEVEYNGERVVKSLTLYFDKNNTCIAKMLTDYSKSVTLPTYVFFDLKNKTEEGLRFENGEYIIFSKDGKGVEKKAILQPTADTFSSQGWHYYLVNNLAEYKEKEMVIKLLIPSRLDSLTFILNYQKSEGDLMYFKLEIKNWFIRLFAPSLYLVYDAPNKKLVSYTGPSNIPYQNDNKAAVKIRYDYNQ